MAQEIVFFWQLDLALENVECLCHKVVLAFCQLICCFGYHSIHECLVTLNQNELVQFGIGHKHEFEEGFLHIVEDSRVLMVAHQCSDIFIGANQQINMEYFRPVLILFPFQDFLLCNLSLVQDPRDKNIDDCHDTIHQVNSE